MSSTRAFASSATATSTAATTLPSPVQALDSALPPSVFDKASLELISSWRSKAARAPARPAETRRPWCNSHSSEWRDPRPYRLDRAHVRSQAMRCAG